MIKILLADDHQIVRSGLKMIIENLFIQVQVDEAWDGDSAINNIKVKEYDLLILDVNMPNTDSIGLVTLILTYKPQSKILICSMNAEDVYAKKFLQAGAKGYINKKASSDEIYTAINTVLNNKRYISPYLTQILTDNALGNESHNPFDALSPKEFEIVQHLIRGESVGEISQALHLHTSTIGTHKGRILEKLKVKNLVELNELAKLHHIISSV